MARDENYQWTARPNMVRGIDWLCYFYHVAQLPAISKVHYYAPDENVNNFLKVQDSKKICIRKQLSTYQMVI
jgi:hypothetical protein